MAQEFPSPTPPGPGPVQEFPAPPVTPPKRNNNTVWIVVAVVVVLLCCCCLIGAYVVYQNFDTWFPNGIPSSLIPLVTSYI